ncbi:MAG: hypothetical protein DHS20C11_27070 [Lysobacteraceae bacterium]|nr:MAG: hypothetical protein DHS20C11_27070 [Xanthomonadaceae bacterium]
MRVLFLSIVLLSSSGLVSAQSAYQRAIAAYQNGETEKMLEIAQQALSEQPASPLFAYLNAVALVLNDRPDDAVDVLNKVADRGISLGAEREPAFAALAEHPGFKEVVARFNALNQATGLAEEVAVHRVGDFVPEGLVILANGDILLGSVRHQRIDKIWPDGQVTTWAASGSGGLRSAFGMRADESAGKLWVASSGMAEAASIAEDAVGQAAILAFNLTNAEPMARFDAPGDQARVLGDLVVAGHLVYTTDSLTGEVLELNSKSGLWRTVVAPGQLVSPQGLVLDAEQHHLFVADYRTGIHRIDLKTGDRIQLSEPDNVSAHGIDGLYRYGTHTLIATRNGYRPNGVLRFVLSPRLDAIESSQLLVGALDVFDDPTLGQIVGDDFYFIANSHWPQFDADKNLPPAEQLTPPLIMKLPLD